MEKTQQTITVLGKTFNSEEERRSYFREELRKKLPELKQMEGFPIGEDEDILKLSDPPYYTACPNPWLNDFIGEWEEKKTQFEKEGKRSSEFVVDEPFATDVSEGKRNAIYGAHSYHTKVPHPAIMRYILFYTQVGDVIFDGFAGTGMAGVGSNHIGKPEASEKLKIDNEWKKMFAGTPRWGQRYSICGDLSPVASLIASVYNKNIDLNIFFNEIQEKLEESYNKFSWMYKTSTNNNTIVDIDYIVWSEVFECPSCGKSQDFWCLAADEVLGKVNTEFTCTDCGIVLNKRKMLKVQETVYDPILKETASSRKLIPVKISYTENGIEKWKKSSKEDLDLLDRIDKYQIDVDVPLYKIPKGDKTGEPIRMGITHTYKFYTKRTLIILSDVFKKLQSNEEKFLFTATLTGLSLQQRYRPKSSFPNMILTGTLYSGSMIREWNVFNWYSGKIKNLKKAFIYNDKNKSTLVYTGSASNSGLESNSVDYIFTDPPFGSNLMYSELNFQWESWLKVFTNNTQEAIENKTQGKRLFSYQTIMTSCFKEYFRILKPGKWMTVEFSNTSAAVWNSIQTALQNSGFIVANVASIDKKQKSYNALNNLKSVKQDLVISCYKPSSNFDHRFNSYNDVKIAIWDFVTEHLNHLPIHLIEGNSTTAIIERNPKILFDRLIAFYVQKSLPVPIDTGKFQQGLRERFIERDGMFFTNEQVQEYDKKKAENPEFIQLSILISSEQDGVLWLKNLLSDKSLAYQDIHPLWIQALAGARKGDVIPELAAILDDNFLKDDQGKWFVPNPEKEADLERLRTKRLLKQFEAYKTEAFKPKGKIKEVRVEALRAGFKEAYQVKDFKTIVSIGDRIPNNLLMEDEVLLQFYDIAVSRV